MTPGGNDGTLIICVKVEHGDVWLIWHKTGLFGIAAYFRDSHILVSKVYSPDRCIFETGLSSNTDLFLNNQRIFKTGV